MTAAAVPAEDLRAALSLMSTQEFDLLVKEEWRRRRAAASRIPAADVQAMRNLHERSRPQLTWREVWQRFPAYNPRTIRAILYYERRLDVTPVVD